MLNVRKISFALCLFQFHLLAAQQPDDALKVKTNALPNFEVVVIHSIINASTTVRIRITRRGFIPAFLPSNAIKVMHGVWDHADGYGFQPDSSFCIEDPKTPRKKNRQSDSDRPSASC
jgi:hypothetical protein